LKDEEGNTFAPLTRDGSIHVSYPSIVISPCSVELGSTVNVSIVIRYAEYIAGGSMTLIFNSLVINVIDVIQGDFGMPIADISDNGSIVSLTFSLTSAVGKPNATLAMISFIGISEGVTYFNVENAELHDEQGNSMSPRFFNPQGWYSEVMVIPEFQPIGILLVCLLLGSIVIVTKKKLRTDRTSNRRTHNQLTMSVSSEE
jgi:hypothetical protein